MSAALCVTAFLSAPSHSLTDPGTAPTPARPSPGQAGADRAPDWRAGGKDDRLSTRADGRRGGKAVVVRSTKDARASMQPAAPMVATAEPGQTYEASAWVRSPSASSSIALVLGSGDSLSARRSPSAAVEPPTRERATRGVDATRWHRLRATYAATSAAPLSLAVVARGLRGKDREVVVDDVSLSILPATATAAPTSQSRPPAPPVTTPTSKPNPKPTPTPTPTPSPTPTPTPTPPPTTTPTPPPAPAYQWNAGASGSGVAGGEFATWRGATVPIAGTWNDNYEAQINQWTIQPGSEYGAWRGDLDVAVGGIFKNRGETWRAAAAGAYDARWRGALANVSRAWGDRPGTVYLRFAHEFNGDWYDWSVTAAETADFKAAWRRFRALQQQVAPRVELVFCPNADTRQPGLDWRAAFPGADQVDVLSVDYYNQYPFVSTRTGFDQSILSLDSTGAPRGLERHRQFAAEQRLPFAISEWSSNADMGDSPVFITELRRWLTAHSGTGAGQVLYEIHFNASYEGGQYQFFPTTRQSGATAAYRDLW